jgi:uncharacterized protein YvpB
MSNKTLQWTADEPDPQRGYCGHHASARVGNYAVMAVKGRSFFN